MLVILTVKPIGSPALTRVVRGLLMTIFGHRTSVVAVESPVPSLVQSTEAVFGTFLHSVASVVATMWTVALSPRPGSPGRT